MTKNSFKTFIIRVNLITTTRLRYETDYEALRQRFQTLDLRFLLDFPKLSSSSISLSAASFSYAFTSSRVASARIVLPRFPFSVEHWETERAAFNWSNSAFFQLWQLRSLTMLLKLPLASISALIGPFGFFRLTASEKNWVPGFYENENGTPKTIGQRINFEQIRAFPHHFRSESPQNLRKMLSGKS